VQKIITVLTIVVVAACTGSSQWSMWSDGGISLSLGGGGSAISVTAASDHLDNAYNFGAGQWLEGGYLVRASLDSGLAASQIGVRLTDDSGGTCYAERRAVVLGEVATFSLPATSCHNFTVGAHTYGPDDVGYSGTLQIQMIGLGTE